MTLPPCRDGLTTGAGGGTLYTFVDHTSGPFSGGYYHTYGDTFDTPLAVPAGARRVDYTFNFTVTGGPVTIVLQLMRANITGKYVPVFGGQLYRVPAGPYSIPISFDPNAYVSRGLTADTSYSGLHSFLIETASGLPDWKADFSVYADSDAHPGPDYYYYTDTTTPAFSVTLDSIVTTAIGGFGVLPPFPLTNVAPGATATLRAHYVSMVIPTDAYPFTSLIALDDSISGTGTQSNYPYGAYGPSGFFPVTYTAVSQRCMEITVSVANVSVSYPPFHPAGYQYWIYCAELSGSRLVDHYAPQVWLVSEAFAVDLGSGGGSPPPPPPPPPGTLHGLSYDVSDARRHVRAYSTKKSDGTDGPVKVGVASDVIPLDFKDVASNISAQEVCIRWDRQSTGNLLYILTGAGNLYSSQDEGSTFTMSVSVGSGVHPALVIARDGRKFCFMVSGKSITCTVLDAANAVVRPSFTAISGGVDNDVISADETVTDAGKWYMTLMYRSGGSVTLKSSQDGTNYT